MLVHDVDVDPTDLDDMVEAILISILSDIGSGFSEPKVFNGVFKYGAIQVHFKVDCEDNFYGQGLSKHLALSIIALNLFSSTITFRHCRLYSVLQRQGQ